jgi:uncharacterized protein YoxC
MNIKEQLQERINRLTKEYQEKVNVLNQGIEMCEELPDEIKSLNDCNYAYGYVSPSSNYKAYLFTLNQMNQLPN